MSNKIENDLYSLSCSGISLDLFMDENFIYQLTEHLICDLSRLSVCLDCLYKSIAFECRLFRSFFFCSSSKALKLPTTSLFNGSMEPLLSIMKTNSVLLIFPVYLLMALFYRPSENKRSPARRQIQSSSF